MINPSSDHDKLLAVTAEILRERRNQLGLSQEELSTRSGLHRTYISDIELGKRNISLLNLVRLASALGFSASELLGKAQERAVILLAQSSSPIAMAPPSAPVESISQ